MNPISDAIKSVRQKMREAGVQALFVQNADAHASEYIEESGKLRTLLSGFTGSRGDLIITPNKAGLWTDFRYFIQAAAELDGSGIALYKEGEEGVPSMEEFLQRELSSGDALGLYGRSFPLWQKEQFKAALVPKGVILKDVSTLFETLKEGMDEPPIAPVFLMGTDLTGRKRGDKLEELRSHMISSGADFYLLNTLDDIAWLLNIRGSDIPYNPLVLSFLLIDEKRARFYIDKRKVSDKIEDVLLKDNVALRPYDKIYDDLYALSGEGQTFMGTRNLTMALVSSVKEGTHRLLETFGHTALAKSVKNPVEQENIRHTMKKDGAALFRFILYLRENWKKDSLDEYTAAEKLYEFRSRMEGFQQDSFNPIFGYKENGAMCHYAADPATAKKLSNDSILLIDSGGQYLTGTTDITRTFAMGIPSAREIRDYTMVLKSHLALAMVRFPKGTKGIQLDAITRAPLWKEGVSYGHGTGHGVGFFLCVHEEPMRINTKHTELAFKPGVLNSNEPGIYREGSHGIRIENLILCQEDETTEFGSFLSFETVTLYPYERALIDVSLLSEEEIAWVDAYHERVFEGIKGYLSEDEEALLKAECAPLKG